MFQSSQREGNLNVCKNVQLGLSIQTGLLHIGLTSSECPMYKTEFSSDAGFGGWGDNRSKWSFEPVYFLSWACSKPAPLNWHCSESCTSGTTRVIWQMHQGCEHQERWIISIFWNKTLNCNRLKLRYEKWGWRKIKTHQWEELSDYGVNKGRNQNDMWYFMLVNLVWTKSEGLIPYWLTMDKLRLQGYE